MQFVKKMPRKRKPASAADRVDHSQGGYPATEEGKVVVSERISLFSSVSRNIGGAQLTESRI